MKRIILHIGRHKSGTTSVQKFLYSNERLLESYGFHYPKSGIKGYAHHQYAEGFMRQNLKRADKRYHDKNARLIEQLKFEIDPIADTVIISSEAYQNCDPSVISAIFSGYDVQLVVYLREQVGYMASAYAQKVHATSYCGSMSDYYENAFRADYFKFLQKWDKAFKGNISVRIFDRSCLINGDVVYDFASSILGMESKVVKQHYVEDDANPTISNRLLAYKLYVNRNLNLTSLSSRLIYRGLSELARQDKSERVLASEEIAYKTRIQYEESNRKVARRYFSREHLFENKRDNYGKEFDITTEEIREISLSLIALFPELGQDLGSETNAA